MERDVAQRKGQKKVDQEREGGRGRKERIGEKEEIKGSGLREEKEERKRGST